MYYGKNIPLWQYIAIYCHIMKAVKFEAQSSPNMDRKRIIRVLKDKSTRIRSLVLYVIRHELQTYININNIHISYRCRIKKANEMTKCRRSDLN